MRLFYAIGRCLPVQARDDQFAGASAGAGAAAGAGALDGAGAGAEVDAGAGAMLDTFTGVLIAKEAHMLTTQMKMARVHVAFSMKSVVLR